MCIQVHKIANVDLDTAIAAVNTYITDNKLIKLVSSIQCIYDSTNYNFLLTYIDIIEKESV